MYQNIQKALENQKLSVEQQAENYNLFSKLMDEGVLLSDLIKKAEEPKQQHDPELFSAMESVVKDDPEIIRLKEKATRIKAQVLSELCYKDARYRDAIDEYRKAVGRIYVAQRDGTPVVQEMTQEQTY